MDEDTCPTCGQKFKGLGGVAVHHVRAHGCPMPSPPCSHDGCPAPVKSGGLCGKHYQRKLKSGSTLDPPAPAERFWPKVDKDGPVPQHDPTLGPCWLWTGTVSCWGYGLFHSNGGTQRAHRFSLELESGAIAAGLYVCHRCDNKVCVRPSHLYAGTHAQNTADAVQRGRTVRGPSMTHSKLTPDAVRAIRSRHAEGETVSQLSRDFGVTRSNVRAAIDRRTWAWVD